MTQFLIIVGSWACEVTVHTVNQTAEEEDESPQKVGVMSLEVCGEKLISGGDDSLIRIWNTNNWTCEQILRAHEDEVWSLRITADNLLISGSVDGTIRVWRQEATATLANSSSQSNLSAVSYPSSSMLLAPNRYYSLFLSVFNSLDGSLDYSRLSIG